jgi:hypothetical protein
LNLAPGTYELLCDVAWHDSNGMFTTLVVRLGRDDLQLLRDTDRNVMHQRRATTLNKLSRRAHHENRVRIERVSAMQRYETSGDCGQCSSRRRARGGSAHHRAGLPFEAIQRSSPVRARTGGTGFR